MNAACAARPAEAVEGFRGSRPLGSITSQTNLNDVVPISEAIACAQWSAIQGQHEAKQAAPLFLPMLASCLVGL